MDKGTLFYMAIVFKCPKCNKPCTTITRKYFIDWYGKKDSLIILGCCGYKVLEKEYNKIVERI